jgi:hypothetical protein
VKKPNPCLWCTRHLNYYFVAYYSAKNRQTKKTSTNKENQPSLLFRWFWSVPSSISGASPAYFPH